MIKKLKLLTSMIVGFSPIFLSISLITESVSSISNQSISNNENIYKYAKVDPIVPIKTIRKTGSDKDRVNLLYLGDGYLSTDNKNMFSDHVYKNIITPWFSTVPEYGETNKNKPWYVGDIGVNNHYQTYLNDKFNVYSIQPNSLSNSIMSENSFFGVHKSRNDINSTFAITQNGLIKMNVLSQDMNNNFLEDGGFVDTNYQNIVHNTGRGRAISIAGIYLTTTESNYRVHQHEFGHALYRFGDEYYSPYRFGDEYSPLSNESYDNIAFTNDPNNIKWKEFLNFRGVGIKLNGGRYIPTYDECVMFSHQETDIEFCEVCGNTMIKKIVNRLQDEYLYIADPQLRIDLSNQSYPSYKKSLESEIYDFNIESANNKKLEFRTVVNNLTSNTRKLKLRIKIIDNNEQVKFSEESEVYEIKPKEVKGLCLTTTKAMSDLSNNSGLKIYGDVIDVETNQVLATHLDRRNKYFNYGRYANQNSGKKLYKIKINFIDKDTNKQLEDIYPTTIVQREGTNYKLEKILFNGYSFQSSSVSEMKIDNLNKDIEVNYYYKKLPSKKLKLKLIEPSTGYEVSSKFVIVYEGQKFLPKSSDFFLWDLDNFNSDNGYEKTWNLSVEPVDSNEISYSNINDNSVISYKLLNKRKWHINSIDRYIVKGAYKTREELVDEDFLFQYKYDYQKYDDSMHNIIYSDIDYNTPGDYQIISFIDRFENQTQANIRQYKKTNIKIIDSISNKNITAIDEVKSEATRLGSINYLHFKNNNSKYIYKNDLEKITKDNLLDKFDNLCLKKNKFQYEVINFKKEMWGTNNWDIKFRVKVSLDGQSFETVDMSKSLVSHDQPIDDEFLLREEITRIGWLNLALRNDIDKKYISNISSKNIFLLLDNWVPNDDLFIYEPYNFKIDQNKLSFQIKVSTKSNNTKYSNEFVMNLSHTGTTPPTLTDQQLLDHEVNRINVLEISLIKNKYRKEELENISESNFNSYLKNWNEVTQNLNNNFIHKIINFSKDNNLFKFKIEITKNSLKNVSKEFSLSYEISNDDVDNNILLENELNRINDINIQLSKTNFLEFELQEINESNFSSYLDKWDEITLNKKNGFDYIIIDFSKANNVFDFKIKVSKNNVSKLTNKISLNYQIKTIPSSEDQKLIEEVTRINQLNINLLKREFTQDELNNLQNDFESYLVNWKKAEGFNYEFLPKLNVENSTISLLIKVSSINNKENFLFSNKLDFQYSLVNNDKLNNNNWNITIFIAIIIPLLLLIVIITTISCIYLKKRKYK